MNIGNIGKRYGDKMQLQAAIDYGTGTASAEGKRLKFWRDVRRGDVYSTMVDLRWKGTNDIDIDMNLRNSLIPNNWIFNLAKTLNDLNADAAQQGKSDCTFQQLKTTTLIIEPSTHEGFINDYYDYDED